MKIRYILLFLLVVNCNDSTKKFDHQNCVWSDSRKDCTRPFRLIKVNNQNNVAQPSQEMLDKLNKDKSEEVKKVESSSDEVDVTKKEQEANNIEDNIYL